MAILSVLLMLVFCALIFYVLWWGKKELDLGEPWAKVLTVVLVVATVVVVIGVLIGKIAPFPFLKF